MLIALFVLQKPIFILTNQPADLAIGAVDIFQVIWHGVSLDISTSAYIFLLPLLLVIISLWVPKIKLRKALLPYYILISFVCGAIFIGDNSLYGFWKFKLDATVFMYLATPKEAFASVSIWFILLRILEVVVYTAFSSWVLYIITPKSLEIVKHKILYTALSPIIIGILVVIIRGGFGMSTTNVGQVYFSDKQFLNHAAINPAFNLLYSMGKADDFASEFNFLPENERYRLFNSLYPEKDTANDSISDTILINKRPNVLIFLMEGFGSNFITSLGSMNDVTPNFDKMIDEGVIFTQCYGNSFRTDRGMVSALSGYLGLPNTSIMKMPAKSQSLPSIANSLVKAGYTTDFLYGGDINFTNMQSYLRGTGYQKIVSDKDFTLKERTTNAWGVNDDITFNYIFKEIQKRPANKPWMTTFLTLSSHEPFKVPYRRLKEDVPNAMAYTDSCMGNFIKRLKKTPAWDNLLIICVADHGSYYPISGVRADPKYFRIPLLFTGGAIKEHKKFDYYVNQSDIAATLLSQMDLPHNDFRYSRNILSQEYKKYPFACYTFYNGFGFVDNTGLSVFDNDGLRTIIEEGSKGISSEQRVVKGKSIIQTIYDDLGSR